MPLILSGGLTPENVGAAIARGAARSPSTWRAAPSPRRGVKDPEKLAAFAAAVAEVTAEYAAQAEAQAAAKAAAAEAAAEAAGRRGRGARLVSVSGGIEHRFGPYGGQYVPETLMPALEELEAAWLDAWRDAGVPRRARRPARATTPGARRRSTWPSG